MILVKMPKANENLTEATLDRWLVPEGASVVDGQALCEIITDKAKFELPSPGAGIIFKRFADERAVLPVDFVLCLIGDANETIPADIEARNEALLAAHRGMVTAPSLATGPMTPASDSGAGAGVRATPAARRLAKELGVDLAAAAKALNPSAPLNEKDVRAFSERKISL